MMLADREEIKSVPFGANRLIERGGQTLTFGWHGVVNRIAGDIRDAADAEFHGTRLWYDALSFIRGDDIRYLL